MLFTVRALHRPRAIVFLAFLVIAPPSASAAPCSCEHLEALKAELRNARTLQTRFREKSTELRSMGQLASMAALKAFAEGPAGHDIKASPGYKGPRSVEYVPHGDNVSVDAIERRSNAELCEFSGNTKRDLERAAAGSQCSDIAEAIHAHEAHHRSMCLAIGYRNYSGMHGADRAREEVEAYEVQAARLREGIRRVLANAQVEVRLKWQSNLAVPANPLYTGLEVKNTATIATTAVAAGPAEIRFEGRGDLVSNPQVLGGNCKMQNVPLWLRSRAIVASDGETAQIRFAPEGTLPALGMVCRVPGEGMGWSMSMPVPVDLSAGYEWEGAIPFNDGGKIRSDLKDSEAAHILASEGLRLTGSSEVEINLRCESTK